MTEADAALIKTLHKDLEVPVAEVVQPEQVAEVGPVAEEPAVLAAMPTYQATESAAALAREARIDLTEITGSGQNGRIIMRDVQAIVDERTKLLEAATDPEGTLLQEIQYLGDSFGRFDSIYHYARTIHPMGGLGEEIKSPQEIKDFIEQDFFAKGWELAFVEPLGFGPDGLSVIWILGKVREGLKPRHTEIWHIQRTLGSNVMEGQITGFGANTYLNSFLSEGWSVFCAKPMSRGGSEVPMIWVLVR